MDFNVNMNDYEKSLQSRTLGGVTKESAIGALAKLKAAAQEAIGNIQRELEQYKGKTAQEMADLTSQKDKVELNLKQTQDALVQQRKSYETETAALKAELKEAKEFAAKYEPMAKVRSVEEIGAVMPDEAIKIMDEIIENKAKALQSMQDYLLTGKGQEEALKQLDRLATMGKAEKDGITNIPEVKEKIEDLKKEGFYYFQSLWAALNMVENSLFAAPKSGYLASSSMKEQIKKNAMGLLTPLCNDMYCNTTKNAIEKQLEEKFAGILKFMNKKESAKKVILRDNPGTEIKDTYVPFDNKKSNLSFIDKEGNEKSFSYGEVDFYDWNYMLNRR